MCTRVGEKQYGTVQDIETETEVMFACDASNYTQNIQLRCRKVRLLFEEEIGVLLFVIGLAFSFPIESLN